ncbi:MAG: hypothetical protein US52_C0036G0001, partial [candidate division WS6 bacterium GW2011_GWA2_37_6]
MKEEVYEKKKKGSTVKKFKRSIACCSIILFIVAIMVGIVGVFTATGHTKKWVCDVILEDSYIWEKIECSKDGVDSTSGNGQDNAKELEDLSSTKPDERVVAIVKLVQPSVVGIGVKGQNGDFGVVGTGFVVKDGLIATNHHVVSEIGLKYFVQVNGKGELLTVTDIYEDSNNDIAILKVSGAEGIEPLSLGDSSKLEVGQEVIAIGNPLGDLSGTVTKGIISALGRNVQVNQGDFFNSRLENFEGVIQTDAAINPGNSGGPLIDMNGRVIGINFATVNGAENLSFALPIDRVQSRLNELEQYGEFRIPYIGVQYIDKIVFVSNKSVVAVQVINVVPTSPAAKAGIKVGDFIIGFDGEDFSDKSFVDKVQDSKIGEKVKLEI